jgi:hypothetical protein
MFKKLTITIIFVSVYVEGLFAAHAQDLGFVPGSLFVMMSIFALTTLVSASAYYREDKPVYEAGDDDVEVETPEPFTYTDKITIPDEAVKEVVVEDEAVDVEVVEDVAPDFTETILFELPGFDEDALDKELEEALNEETRVEPAWTEEPKEASAETDKMINDLFNDVDDDGAPTLDPDVKVQSYTLEESVIEDEYIPIPEEDKAELIELEDLIKTVSEGLDTEIDTTKVIAVMADGNESITLEELSNTVAEGLDVEDIDTNLVDDDAYDKTITVDKDM